LAFQVLLATDNKQVKEIGKGECMEIKLFHRLE
jgi:hypothetical protein